MKRSIRHLAVTIAICFMISCYSTIQTHALEQEAAANKQPAGSEVKTEEQKDTTPVPKAENKATQTTAQTKEKVPEKAAVQTTGAAIKTANSSESLWYSKKLPMKKEHQKLLWEYCKKRNINYIDMLALIYTESNFYEKCKTGKFYGYFQISKGNCAGLAKTLKTSNKPLDGAININWGTAYYSWILADKRVKGLTGKKQRDAALSIYQRGTLGYDKSGISTRFLKTYYKKRDIVCSWFGVEG